MSDVLSRLKVICVLAAISCFAGPASAEPPAGVDRSAEVEKLQREVDALRSVLVQMLEIERMRVELLSQALKAPPKSVARESTPREPPREPARETAREAPRGAPSLDGAEGEGAREAAAVRDAVREAVREAAVRKVSAVTEALGKNAKHGGTGMVSGRVLLPEGLRVAYVFVENVRGPILKSRRVAIEQRNKQFQPEWAVVQVGTTIEFPNLDDIYHNVFSLSTAAPFDLGLYRNGEQAKERRFMTPGVVDIYCNIHPRMVASVLVVPNDLFTRVRADGSFELPGVPEGKRKIVAWAPGAELGSEWVDVAVGADAKLDFRLPARSSVHRNKVGQAYGSYE